MTQRSETDIVNEHLERIARMPREVSPEPIDLDDLGSPRPLVWIAVAWMVAVAVGLILWPGKASPQERDDESTPQLWVAVNTVSWHHQRTWYDERGQARDVNALNWGAGLEGHFAHDLRLLAGGYRNSYDRGSAYLLAGWQPLAAQIGRVSLSAGAFAGAVTGYQHKCGQRICPAAGALLSVEGARFGANVIAAPPIDKKNGAVVALQLKWRAF